jgi:hypothetical protein
MNERRLVSTKSGRPPLVLLAGVFRGSSMSRQLRLSNVRTNDT